MPETPSNQPPDFQGDLSESIDHILEAPDTEEDLKKKFEYAQATLKEFTNAELDSLRESFQIKEGQEIILRSSMDARLALAAEIEADTDELTKKELVGMLSRVLEEEIIESAIRVEDLDSMSVSDLRELEKKTPGTLLFAFTTWGDKHKELEVSALGNGYLPEVGDEYTIDFRGNEEAYWAIGAADLMPPEARGIKVTKSSGEVRESTHRVGLKGEERGGFYDEQGYIPIFSGDVIEVKGVDASIRDHYFNPETNEWDHEKYQAEHPEEEALLTMPVGVGDETLGSRSFNQERHGYSQSYESLKEQHEEWVHAAEQASDHFDRRLGIRVQPTTTFAVISKESNFDTNAVSSSGCMGLGQFAKGTWMDFIRQNRALAKSVYGERLPVRKSEILKLRTHPALNIYATTWYLAKIAKRTGQSHVDSSNIHGIYLCYHEGVAGKKALERYVRTGRGRLYKWQRKDPEGYWKFLNSYAGQVAAQAERYEGEVA